MRTAFLSLLLVSAGFAQQAQQPPAQQQPGGQQQPFGAGDVLPADPAQPAPQPGSGTQPASGEVAADEPITRIITRAPEVNLVMTVTDKRGKFIRDLKKDNFVVFDNKRQVPEIRSFSSQTNLPLRVGLVIDVSNSIRDRFKFEQEAAIEFLNQIIRPKEDQAFVLGFDSTPEVTQEWTSSTEKLSSGIRMLRPGGGTAFYDAIYYACRDKLARRTDPGSVRKAIIVLSDGDDNQSRVTLAEAIEMAQRAEVIVYTISTNLAPNSDRGDKVLQQLSEATGGRTFHPFKIEDVANAFQDIQDELRSQYLLAYRPPDLLPDGSYRTVEVRMPDNKRLKVRTRKGYFAPKP